MIYVYFISYRVNKLFGRCEFKNPKEITSISDIDHIESVLYKSNGNSRIIITNYILLRIEVPENKTS